MKGNFRRKENGTFKRVLVFYEDQEEVLVIADYHVSSLDWSIDNIF